MIEKTVNILLVEDNQDDIDLAVKAMNKTKIKNRLHITMDGIEALMFVRKLGKYIDSPTPDLILLDLNLPRKDGREVLAEIKLDTQLRQIPVIILTTSKADEDILESYKNYANCYIVKPYDFVSLVSAVNTIEDFWFNLVKLPAND